MAVLAYRCTLHQVMATVDPETRTVRVRLPHLGLDARHATGVTTCQVGQVAHRALEHPDAPCGPHGPHRPEAQGRRCEVVREA